LRLIFLIPLYQFMKKHLLSTVSVFKNENDYLHEWLEYHLMMGVDHMYLYDQDGGLDAMELLRPYERAGLVTRHPWTHFDGTRYDKTTHFWERDKSHIAYAHCAKNYRNESQWIQKLDIDEYLVMNDGGNDLKEWVKTLDVNRIKGYRVYRYNFGNNGHLEKPPGLITESYTRRESEYSDYKDAGNGDFLSNNRYHYNSHKWAHKFGKSGQVLTRPEDVNIHINHYYTKSYTEYRDRQNVMRSRDTSLAAFENMNAICNKVEDHSMLRHTEILRTKVAARRQGLDYFSN